jgi:hypothetical protein
MSKALGFCAFVLACVTLSTGFAVAATKPPTVQQVQDQEQLIAGEDTPAAIRAWSTLNPRAAQPACQAQMDHVAALKAMVRPKRYPKATWKILMRGSDLFAKVAAECVAAAQAEIAGHDSAALDAYVAGYKQAKPEWDEANALFDKANRALTKAKIR